MTSFDIPCNSVCDLPPFSSEVEPQDPPTANSISIMRDEIQSYMRRLLEALCEDLDCINNKLVDLNDRVTALEP